MQTCILEIFLEMLQHFKSIREQKSVKYDIESFLSAFLQQLPVWIAL